MSDANAKSSTKASKKEVEKLKLVMGSCNADKTFEMPPENAKEFRNTFEEIVVIKAENHEAILDKNGKIIKRVDEKTGYVLDRNSVKKAINNSKTER